MARILKAAEAKNVYELIKALKGATITPMMKEDLLLLIQSTEKVSIRKGTKLLNKLFERNNISVDLGSKATIKKPYKPSSFKLADPEAFRAKRKAQVLKAFEKLDSDSARVRRQGLDTLTKPRQREVQETEVDRDNFINKLERHRERNIKKGRLETGALTVEEENNVQAIQKAVFRGYKRSGTRVLSGDLIQSLLVKAIRRKGKYTQYVLESNMYYAKYVDGYKSFSNAAKAKCKQLTGHELLIDYA